MLEKRLINELKDSMRYVKLNVLFQWIKLVTNVVFVVTIGLLLQSLLQGSELISLFSTVSICIIMIALRFASTIAANRMSFKAIGKVKAHLRDRLYGKLLRIGSSYHEKIATSEVVQIAAEGIEQLEIYMGRYLPQFYYSMLAPLTLFVIIAPFSIKSALILLLCVPLIPISIIAFNRIAKKIMKKYWNSYADLGDTFLENIQGLTTLKIYQADQRKHQRMNEAAEDFRIITMKLLRMQLNSIVIMNLIAFGGAAIAIIIAASEYQSGNIVFWQAFAIIMLGAEFFIPLRLLGSYFHVAMNGTTACDKLFNILGFEEKNTSLDTDTPGAFTFDEVSLNEVDYAYGDNDLVLKKVSLSVKKGEFISVVGPSGCGKSTIAGLIMGINTGYKGSITMGGVEATKLAEALKMKNMTLVTHDSYLFKGTVRENLLIGDISASDNKLFEVLDQVNLKDFILAEGGLDFMLMEQGGNLSGGQKQRLAIARALLHDSDIYIFDEATSNIDVESENMIMKLINEMAATKTIILISHRLANVVKSDRIYVLDHGSVKECGNHQELLAAKGLYVEMYEQQQSLEKYGKGDESNA